MTNALPKNHVSIPIRKIGILLVNLGTPEATSYWAMRSYLKEFLSDPRVIEVSRPVWWLILNAVILTFRPTKSGHAYEKIWNRELNESPLKTFTRGQAEKLANRFSEHDDIIVDWAMRYGKPPIAEGLNRLKHKGCDRVLMFPLYPQYSAATTASVFDKTADAMRAIRWQPTLRFVPPFFDDENYIKALATRTNEHLKSLTWKPEKVLISYHGLPQDYLTKGDPYHCHCQKTSRLLSTCLDVDPENIITTFQSRVGRKEWLRPYTDEVAVELAKSGVKNILVISPAFISDCVETLEELSIALAEEFMGAGGKKLSVAPCLNDSEVSIDLLARLANNELKGWIN